MSGEVRNVMSLRVFVWFLLLLLAVGLPSLSGCSCGAAGTRCESDNGCARGEICKEGFCASGCRAQADCDSEQFCVQSVCTQNLCVVGSERACAAVGQVGAAVGLCSDGYESCVRGGTLWSGCTAIKPQAEICDRLDNDCDGKVDEPGDDGRLQCECTTPGSMRFCYYGPQGSHRVGTCASGVQYCTASYIWGRCHDARLPRPEICDNLDNDCDGKVDDGISCDCEPGTQRSCYPAALVTMGKGVCRKGKQLCGTSRKWGKCEGAVIPSREEDYGCNGKDDDCDGNIDERADGLGTLQACAACADGETQKCFQGPLGAIVGRCKPGKQTCKGGTWGKCEGQVLPEPELCGDGKDNDCDGNVDEGCKVTACQNGDKRDCFDGPIGRAGYLPCQVGKQTCDGGRWGACLGQVLPKTEVCNDGKDNDCDGRVDEGCKLVTCSPNGKEEPCYNGVDRTRNVGSCKAGKRICYFGRWGSCIGEVLPATKDLCDGKDDDCDGRPDTGCECQTGESRQCYPEKQGGCRPIGDGTFRCNQPCKAGTQRCVAGTWEKECKELVAPQTERCNDQDDDCDGVIDNIQRPCYTGLPEEVGKGSCKKGNQTCTAGTWGACIGEIKPIEEVCDGKDNNCNGLVDEGDPKLNAACVAQGRKGPCRNGAWRCESGTLACLPTYQPKAEDCANGIDDDCDGTPDGPPCQCQSGKSRSCYSGPFGTQNNGDCAAGKQTCSAGKWGPCVGERLPQREACDNQDNDCNGLIDDLLTRNCFSGNKGCTLKADGSYQCTPRCRAGVQTCAAGQWGSCKGESLPAVEICDGLDNDCDGQTDEALQRKCYAGKPGTKGRGECQEGSQQCVSGRWGTCRGEVLPSVELCDGKDNDCDGTIDEGLERSCYNGPVGSHKYGICKQGKQTCRLGNWGTCNGEILPVAEKCNNKDDDCDGAVDEKLERTCYTGANGTLNVGLCRAGKETCTAGQWGSCVGDITPKTDVCDGKDNDCDGQSDENGCVCTDGMTRPCGSNTGACEFGMQECRNNQWQNCQGGVGPQPERCDGIDNNCDGQIDENWPQLYNTCTVGVGECSYTSMWTCNAVGNGVFCPGSAKQPQPEICDEKDNDCDGLVDEGLNCGPDLGNDNP